MKNCIKTYKNSRARLIFYYQAHIYSVTIVTIQSGAPSKNENPLALQLCSFFLWKTLSNADEVRYKVSYLVFTHFKPAVSYEE